MSRIWLALTAFVLEKSMAACLSFWYCSSVPSTVLRTPVRESSTSTAAATPAAPMASSAGVSVRVSAPPIFSTRCPGASRRSPNSSTLAPARPSEDSMAFCLTMESASAERYPSRRCSHMAMSASRRAHWASSRSISPADACSLAAR